MRDTSHRLRELLRRGALAAVLALVVLAAADEGSTNYDDESGRACSFDKTVAFQLQGKTLQQARAAGLLQSTATRANPNVEWAPIRITVFDENLDDTATYCSAEGLKVPAVDGEDVECGEYHVLTDAVKKTIVEQTIPRVVGMVREWLQVRPYSRLVINDAVASLGGQNRICGNMTLPEGLPASGLTTTDFVLLLTAKPWDSDHGVWFALCGTDDKLQPTVGVMSIDSLDNQMPETGEPTEAFLAHGLLHLLGFNKLSFDAANVVKAVNGVRGQTTPTDMLVGGKVVQAVQKQYNCSSAVGGELDGSHWSARTAGSDAMSGVGTVVPTLMTGAAMEDLGFYRAQRANLEYSPWGYGQGCAFLDGKCVDDGKALFPEFCVDQDSAARFCSFDRTYIGSCTITRYPSPITPSVFQYFADPNLGGESMYDYCPVVGWDEECTSTGTGTTRCVEVADGAAAAVPTCVDVECDAKTTTYKVRIGTATEWVACAAGSTVDVAGSTVVCPAYNNVCAVLPPVDDDFNVDDSDSDGARAVVAATLPAASLALALAWAALV